ncbi:MULTISPECIES: CASTOR/POLLUX-related putative ion channel [Streptomyces]|uniref:CASTOR/POLLUX-related putative ion channel n=1 Tax=Streptomyces TaxID=1883 RepID=UPI0028156A17|nr:NAD-binding lipoprotein [Streptomyces sp. CAI-85]
MAQRQRPTSLRDRARYLFDRTLARSTGALLGWLALCCLAVVVPVSALLVWTDPAAPRSLSGRLTAVWRTSAETLRLGGVTGAPLRMLLSVLLGLITLLCVSTLVGVITTGLGDRLTELRRGRSTVLERGHAVVLGWSDQVFTVVGELIAARAEEGGGVVAVLADRDTAEMQSALTPAPGTAPGVRLVCRTGSLTDPAALALVTPAAAASVLVLPAEGADADLEVVRTLLALRAALGARTGPPVVAAVRDERHLPAARLAAGPLGTVLETEVTTARLLAQAARRPGLPGALRDLLDFAGAEFHVVDAPDHLVGRDFGGIALCFEASCVVGFLTADGRALLAPAPGTVLAAGDRLVVVARDAVAAASAVAVDRRPAVDPTAMAEGGPEEREPSRMLMLGWNRRAPLVVDLLRRTAGPGSRLDVVAGPDGVRGVEGCEGRERLAVVFRPGDPVREETLRGLDVFGYDRVLVLAPDPEAGAERPDDRTLLTLLVLRSLEEEAGRALPVVAELCEHHSRALAPLGPASDAVVRGELTALLMAQIAHGPELAAVFEELFATRGGALALRPAGDHVTPGREASFATVVAAALERGACAIGYRAHGAGGLRLCPRKGERRVWGADDEILVLTAAPGGSEDARVPDGGRDRVPRMRLSHEGGDSPSGLSLG